MASNRKISDLDNVPLPPKDPDFFLIAREDVANYKITFTNLRKAIQKHSVFQTGDQNVSGVKTFFDPINGNLSGTARYVVDGVYVTGDQRVDGVKVFEEYIVGNVSGNLSGTSRYVVDGVYVTGDQSLFGVKDFKDDLYLSGQPIYSLITGEINRYLQPVKETAVYITGNQTISGVKTFDEFIKGNVSGNLSGTARYVQDGVYSTGNQTISGVKTFDEFIKGNVSGNLSGTALYVRSGVYQTGDQKITGRKDFWGDLLVSGKPFTEYSAKLDEKQVLIITGFEQTITGNKTFHDYIIPSGGITTTGDKNNLYIADRESFDIYKNQTQANTLTIAFKSGVFITGGDLHVGGTLHADRIFATDTIVGDSGTMILTDGRDPSEFISPGHSLSLAYQDGVYITGGGDLHVASDIYLSGQRLSAILAKDDDFIEGLSGIQSASGLVITDGREPSLYKPKDKNSLSLAFESGVYITGGADLITEGDIYVGGTLHADALESVDSLIGDSGSMVLTDGRDSALYEGPESSLSLAFESGVYITGGGDLHVGNNIKLGGTLFAESISPSEYLIGDSGSMVLTDGRDPALHEGPESSLSLAFQSGVYITGGGNLYVEGSIIASNVGDLEISSINFTNPVYNIYELELNHSDGQMSLISNGSINGMQTMAYFYNNNWYRMLDDKLLVPYIPYGKEDVKLLLDISNESTLELQGQNISGIKAVNDNSFLMEAETIQNQPFYNPIGLNGKPTMEFDGDNDILTSSSFLPGNLDFEINEITIISVYEILNDYNNYSGALVGFKDNDSSFNDKETFTLLANNNIYHDGYENIGSVSPAPGRIIRISSRDQTTQIDYINGQLNIEEYFPESPVLPFIEGTFVIGNAFRKDLRGEGQNQIDNSYFSGKISEVMVLQGMVTGENARKIEGYLAQKWFGTGINNPLIENHPYKIIPPLND